MIISTIDEALCFYLVKRFKDELEDKELIIRLELSFGDFNLSFLSHHFIVLSHKCWSIFQLTPWFMTNRRVCDISFFPMLLKFLEGA